MKFSGIVPNLPIYHFWRFEQNRYRSFWEKFKKAPKNAHIRSWIIQKNFYQKSGPVILFVLSISNFWPKIRKIHRAVSSGPSLQAGNFHPYLLGKSCQLQRADRTNLTNGLTNLTSQPFQPTLSLSHGQEHSVLPQYDI